MTAAEIIELLREKYRPPEWLTFDEMRVSTGYSRGEQRLDFFAMNTYPSKQYRRLGFEVKISRSDFTAELRKPQKRRPALMLSNRFYFVAPEGIVPLDKLPIDAGLIEVHRHDNGNLGLRTKCEAPWIDTEPPTWGFVAALIRRVELYAKKEAKP